MTLGETPAFALLFFYDCYIYFPPFVTWVQSVIAICVYCIICFVATICLQLKNKGGEVESKAKLDVRAPSPIDTSKDYQPGFETALEDHLVAEGAEVRFTCKVKGHPMPDAKWFLDGTELKNSKEYKITAEEGTLTLLVRLARKDHTGNIVCQV